MDPITIGSVGWSVSIVGWVASAAISKLLSKGFDYLGYDVSKKLEELENKILVLERVMEIVETNQYRARLEQLFNELKSAFYEAEDILDAVEYHRLKEIQDDKRSRAKKLWSTIARNFLRKNMESGMSNKKLIKSLKKIEGIVHEGHQILDKLGLGTVCTDNRRQKMAANTCATAASPEKVIGRDYARDMIIAMLHEKDDMQVQPNTSEDRCYSVIGIHGIGGSGKSTLAQFVCTQEKKDKKDKKKGHFDLVMWVDVSQNFSVNVIWKKMSEAASNSKVPCPEFKNLDVLKGELEKKLHEKRFFLVLDDVLSNNDAVGQDLPLLLSPLKVGKRGSKILVTTRNKDALPDLGPYVRKTFVPVPDFDDTAFLELFMYYALEYGQDRSMTFYNIGSEIAKKLKGSPLAARTVGGNLRRQQEVNHWITVKNQDLFNVCMGPLWWSYYQLSEQARRCFVYCSMFPRRHPLYRDDLVKLWMAEGFIGSDDRGKDMEDVGLDCFNELASTSFLQLGGKAGKDFFGGKDYYLVHDLLYDLAETAAGNDCFRIENGYRWKGIDQEKEVPRDIRHLFVQYYDEKLITRIVLGLENLRTLIIYHVGWSASVEKNIIESICKRLKKLRVLAIAFGPVDTLIRKPEVFSVPESIGKLKHLRYFAFRTTEACKLSLPSTLTELYYMKTLDFGECGGMKLPSAGLINLHHVLCGLEATFPNVGRLLSLQTIPEFTVRNEKGYEVKQLRDLNKICGTLWIKGLENVKSKEEALDANLAAKEGLTELLLNWGGGTNCNHNVAAEVLEGLCPPPGLQTLRIRCYQGSRYPDWMHNSGPEDLQRLMFWDSPDLGRQPAPQLMFPHLRVLKLANSRWDALPGNIEHLTSLKKLRLLKCMYIRSLPRLPLSLEKFSLTDCKDEFTKSCQTVGHENWEKLKYVPIKDFK